MKNKLWIFLILLIIIAIITIAYLIFKNNNKSSEDYTASKTSIEETNTNENNEDKNINNMNIEENNINNTNTINITENSTEEKIKTEEQIASFTTKIYTKESGRQNNVTITCNTLNDTIVPNGSTFSFCNTVGQSTSSKGYQKADIFDKNGNKKKGLGGGNCQVSTTLYNAVLAVPSLVVTERHSHSNKVPYIQSGLDAAVAYGSYDLKFRNDSGNDIKIQCSNTADDITITLLKII